MNIQFPLKSHFFALQDNSAGQASSNSTGVGSLDPAVAASGASVGAPAGIDLGAAAAASAAIFGGTSASSSAAAAAAVAAGVTSAASSSTGKVYVQCRLE